MRRIDFAICTARAWIQSSWTTVRAGVSGAAPRETSDGHDVAWRNGVEGEARAQVCGGKSAVLAPRPASPPGRSCQSKRETRRRGVVNLFGEFLE